ncbi:MAG: tetratricopeptide repeat protein, partial [Planctomycetota bacterium]
MMRLKIILLGILILGCLYNFMPEAGRSISFAQSAARSIYIESEEVEPYLKKAEELEQTGQWRRAIEQYQSIIKKFPDSVCLIDTNYFVGTKQYFFQKLIRYPPEGMAVYHQMFDTLSEGLFGKAVKNSDIALLKRLVDEMFLSAYGDNAANYLAEILVEQGRLAEASGYWEQLLDLYPDSEIPKSDTMLKLAVSYLRQGRQSDYQLVKDKLSANYGHSTVEWGRRQLTVNEILSLLEQLNLTEKTQTDDRSDWLTWGGNNAHNQVINYDGMNDIKKWSHQFAPATQGGFIDAERSHARRLPTERPRSFFTIYPAITTDFIYLNNGVSISQIKADSGALQSVFPPSLQETGNSFALRNNFRFNGIFGVAADGEKIFANIFATLLITGPNPNPVASLVALSAGSLKQLWNTADLNEPFLKEV